MTTTMVTMAMKMAMIFGTKTRVISWICVRAWKSAIVMPTASPVIMIGADIASISQIASRA